LKQLLEEIVTKGKIYKDELMSRHTSFKIGGMAEFFVEPADEEELASVIKLCKEKEVLFYIIGNGSNLLVSDDGLRGVVIKIGDGFDDVSIENEKITAGSGVLLSKIASVAASNELAGFEFAAGIPGSLGGAVAMNAGAYGGEMKDVVVSVRVMDYDGNIFDIPGEDMDFGYRHSKISEGNLIILSAVIELKKGIEENIRAVMKDLAQRRRDKQPLEYPSAGSTFKRPEGYFAGKLIMDAGLSGYRRGGAKVSEKHCGFIVNNGDATCSDVTELIKEVQDIVYEKFGVVLETEVKILG